MRAMSAVLRAFLAMAVVSVLPLAGAAHHSVLGQFDVSKSLTLRGTIEKVDWINPHVYIHLQVTSGGRPETWQLSTIPLAMLRKAGITKESLRGGRGEVVTVSVNPALNGRPMGWVSRITYADGHFYALFE
jgi:hypothetical protein